MAADNAVAEAIRDTFSSPNVSDANFEPANLVDVGHMVAQALHALGTNHAAGPGMGGLEFLAVHVAGSLDRIAEAIELHARALGDVAEALQASAHRPT